MLSDADEDKYDDCRFGEGWSRVIMLLIRYINMCVMCVFFTSICAIRLNSLKRVRYDGYGIRTRWEKNGKLAD